MKRKRFSEEQIIEILKQDSAEAKPADLCRQHGISERRCTTGDRDMAARALSRSRMR
jgi:Transposase